MNSKNSLQFYYYYYYLKKKTILLIEIKESFLNQPKMFAVRYQFPHVRNTKT
jgi:hypothetical protein